MNKNKTQYKKHLKLNEQHKDKQHQKQNEDIPEKDDSKEKKQFDKFATCHRYRNYFQSSMYANVMVKFGYNAKFLGFANKQNKLVGATLILYKEVFMGNKVAYAPRGILANYENLDILNEKVRLKIGPQGEERFETVEVSKIKRDKKKENKE